MPHISTLRDFSTIPDLLQKMFSHNPHIPCKPLATPQPAPTNYSLALCHFRPIFIVNTVQDSDCDNDGRNGLNEIESARVIIQRADMEINNNNSLYLHGKCEDKGDNGDKRAQCESKISQSLTTSVSCRVQKPPQDEIGSKTKMSEDRVEVTISSGDIDESPIVSDKEMTQSADNVKNNSGNGVESSDKRDSESAGNESINQAVITSVSAVLAPDDEVDSIGITKSKVPPMIEHTVTATTASGESEVYFRVREPELLERQLSNQYLKTAL